MASARFLHSVIIFPLRERTAACRRKQEQCVNIDTDTPPSMCVGVGVGLYTLVRTQRSDKCVWSSQFHGPHRVFCLFVSLFLNKKNLRKYKSFLFNPEVKVKERV